MSEMPELDDTDALMAYLFEEGVLILSGIDDSGEFLVNIDMEKAQEICPPFYELVMQDLDREMLELFDEGYVDIEYDENLKPMFSLTEKGRKYAEENGLELE